jgi:DNA-binding transcriptional MocR family regulator
MITALAALSGVAGAIFGGSYDPYMRRTRRAYARHVAAMSQATRRSFPGATRLTRPTGGFVLWVQLPERVLVPALSGLGD